MKNEELACATMQINRRDVSHTPYTISFQHTPCKTELLHKSDKGRMRYAPTKDAVMAHANSSFFILRSSLVLLLLIMLPVVASAQSDDFGIWTSVGAEKKINKKMSVNAEAEFRTRNDSKTADRWSGSLGAEYKLVKGLKMSATYTLLYDNNVEKITYNDDGGYNNWRPSYWGLRHRFSAAMTGDIDFGNFNFSLRECWQYTYRSEKTTDRYDFDNSQWENVTVNGKGKNILRSRLKIEYDIPHCKLAPYASVELYNGWALQKTRYTIGADYKIDKQNAIGIYYRYQDINKDDDNEPNMHILGLNYKFKF